VGPADGTPVVLCHGLAAAAIQFADDAAYLAGRGYRVLVPNLRGHGLSGKGSDYSIARMALDLAEVLAHAGVGPVHWVGNSLGGILALSLLGSHPQIFRTMATFGTSYALSLPRIGARMIPLGYALWGRTLTANVTAWTTTRDPAARKLIASILKDYDPAVGYAVASHLVQYDLIARGMEARVPILLLRCGLDRPVNAALGTTLKAMRGRPHFTLVEVPTGGHCANLDATEDVRRELLSFWGKH
jgi:pimeloyl-ACP methyl ester carboxylesterase